MIFGIGTDIVKVARMQRSIDRWGERFAGRILTTDEIKEYCTTTKKANFLAKRFAAKEAAAKAMDSRTGRANTRLGEGRSRSRTGRG